MLLYFLHGLVSSFITIIVLFCSRKDGSLAKKLSECLEPLSLSELWEPLCRTDGSNPNSVYYWCRKLITLYDDDIVFTFSLWSISKITFRFVSQKNDHKYIKQRFTRMSLSILFNASKRNTLCQSVCLSLKIV